MIIYKPDGTVERRPDGDLQALQAAVEGWIEEVRLRDGRVGYVNECGALADNQHPDWPRSEPLPINPQASELAMLPIRGNLVLCDEAD